MTRDPVSARAREGQPAARARAARPRSRGGQRKNLKLELEHDSDASEIPEPCQCQVFSSRWPRRPQPVAARAATRAMTQPDRDATRHGDSDAAAAVICIATVMSFLSCH